MNSFVEKNCYNEFGKDLFHLLQSTLSMKIHEVAD